VHAGKLGQVTNFTIVGSTAKHCVDQFGSLLFAMPDGLHARLCHALVVTS